MKNNVHIKKVTYSNSFSKEVSVDISKDSVENLAIYIKELQNPISALLGFPSLAKSDQERLLCPKIAKEYRIKGTLNNESLDLMIEEINYQTVKSTYKPLEKTSDIEKCVNSYLREIKAFRGEIVKKEDIQKAAHSWGHDLGIKEETLDILVQNIEDKVVQYKTLENKFFYVPYLGLLGALAGQFISVGFAGGQKYQRRISPILGLPPFNVVNNLFRYALYKNPAPVDVVFENPQKVGIVLPPVVGLFAKKHEIRHALQHAAFSELINPNSKVFSNKSKTEAKTRAYQNLTDLLSQHYFNAANFQNFDTNNKKIPTELFLQKTPLSFLKKALEEDLLENEDSRGIIAGVLFHEAYERGRRMYESTASSFKGNLGILALPWVIPGILKGFQHISEFAGGAILINILLMMGGYGDLFSYKNIKDLLSYAKSPEDELRVIATLGPKILQT